ncbi:MAG: efflux RND transporter periplasmic adaptor subunit [Candidatus Brocadiales bacterium]
MTIPKFLLALIFTLIVASSLSCDLFKTEEAESKDAVEEGLEKKVHKVPIKHANEEQHEGVIKISKESHDILGIETVKITPQTPERYIRATAEIQFNANRVFHVGPRVPSRVVAVFADLGDEVKEGQRLALLDSVELGNAVSEYFASKTRVSVNKANYEREKMLWEKKVSSEREMLNAKSAYLQAKAEYEAAENKLHLFGLKEEDVLALKSQTHSITTFPLLSPFDGTVVEKHIALGEMQDMSAHLFTIADLQVLWIILDIYEKDLAKISIGQEVKVSVSAYPDTYFHSHITYISDVIDERTRTVKVRVEVDNSERKLKPGMFVTAKIIMGETVPGHKRLIIPSSAIESYEGKKTVFVALGNYAYKMKEVFVGREFDGQVEVLEGLNEGDEVVTKGSFYLKSEIQKKMLEHGHAD